MASEIYAFIAFPDLEYASDSLDEGVPKEIRGRAIPVTSITVKLPDCPEGSVVTSKALKSGGERLWKKWKGKLSEMNNGKGTGTKVEEDKKLKMEKWLSKKKETFNGFEEILSKKTYEQLEVSIRKGMQEQYDQKHRKFPTIEVSKDVDSVSTRLHRYCIDSKSKGSQKKLLSEVGVYVFVDIGGHKKHGAKLCAAYILRNCEITELEVESDDDDVPSESFTIQGEEFHSYLRVRHDVEQSGKDKDSEGDYDWPCFAWNYVKQEEPTKNVSEQKGSLLYHLQMKKYQSALSNVSELFKS